MSEARYLLIKRGLYYGPNNRGYTGFKEKAGRYLVTDADLASGVTAVHEDEADEIAPNCFEDLARNYLNEKIASLRAANESALAALERLITDPDDDPCQRDHNGLCQAHFLEEDCSMAHARDLLRKAGRL